MEYNKQNRKRTLLLCGALLSVMLSDAFAVKDAVAQSQVHVPVNQRTEALQIRDGDSVLAFMETDTRYFCYLYQEGVLNQMVNSISFEPNGIQSGGGTAANVRPLAQIPTFENNPSQFVSVESNEEGFQTLPLKVDSVNPNLPQAVNARISCCSTEARGKYNTNATPFNFLELVSSYSGDVVTARVQLFSVSSPGQPVAETQVIVPKNGRVDLGVHDLLSAAGVAGTDFGSVRVVHDGPAGLFDASISLYDQNLTLRESIALNFATCGLK